MSQQFAFKSSLFLFKGENPNCLLILEFCLLFIFKLKLWFPNNSSDHPDHLSHLKMYSVDQDDHMHLWCHAGDLNDKSTCNCLNRTHNGNTVEPSRASDILHGCGAVKFRQICEILQNSVEILSNACLYNVFETYLSYWGCLPVVNLQICLETLSLKCANNIPKLQV